MTLNNIPISRSAVESVIDCNPLIVVPATSLVDAIALMSQVRSTCRLRKFSQQNATSQPEARASCVLVIEGTQLVGLLTEQDLVKLVASGRNLKGVKVADVMKQQLITLKKSEFRDIFSIFNLFSQHRIRHLPVLTDSNQLLGIATPESARQGWQPADLLNLRRVAEVMATQVIQAQPTVSVLSLAQLMVEYQVSCIVITEKITDRTARPLGIVTERDIVQFQALELDFGKLQAQDVMSSPLFCLHPEDSLQTAYEQMLSGRVQRLIVSNSQGEFLGIITQTSLLQAFAPPEMYSTIKGLEAEVHQLQAEKLQLLESRNQELEQEVQVRVAEIQEQIESDRLLKTIALRIRESLSLEDILNTAVAEVRQVLKCDRAIIYRSEPDNSGVIIAESLGAGWETLRGTVVNDRNFATTWIQPYINGRLRSVADIYTAGMAPCHVELLDQLQIRAKLVVPIIQGEKLWGLLSAHQCLVPRNWQLSEIDLLEKLATQLAIAIQQATFLQQLQTELLERQRAEAALQDLNAQLEQRVAQRTAELSATNEQLQRQIEEREKTAAALCNSEEMVRQLTENIREVFFLSSADAQQMLYISPNYQEIWGRSCESLYQQPLSWLDSIHPEDRDRINSIFLQKVQAQEELNEEYRIVRPDGSIRWVWVRTFWVVNQAGQPYRVAGIVEDISDRKQAEEALLESGRRFSTLSRLAPVGIFLTNTAGKCIYVNDRWCGLTGLTFQQATNDGWITALHPEDRERIFIEWDNISQVGLEFDLEYRLLRPDGSVVWVQGQAVSLTDEGGTITGFIGTVNDITERKIAEGKIRQTQMFLHSIVDNIPNMIFVKDVNTLKFLNINKAGEELLGYSRTEIIGKNDYDLFSTKEADFFTAKDRQVLAEGKLLDISEEPIHSQNHGLRILHTKKIPLFDEQGKPKYLLGISEDITERQQSEAALRESEQQYRSVVDTVKEVIFQTDVIGLWKFINPAWTEITGFTVGESIGTFFLDYFHPDDYQLNGETFTLLYNRQKESCRWETRLLAKDGGFRWIEVFAELMLDANGIIVGIAGMINDITEHRQVVEALQESEQRFRQMAENIREVLWMTDPYKQQMIYISPAYEEIWGRTRESLYQHPTSFLESIHPEDRDRIAVALATQTQGNYDEEYRVVQPSGEERWIRDRGFPIADASGQIYRVVGIAEDITEYKRAEKKIRKALEKEQELNELKSRFISTTSHEFRTPLTTILGSTELIKYYSHNWTEEKKISYLDRIQSTVNNMTLMLDDVLLLGKVEAGKLDFQPTWLDLGQFCEDLVEELRPNIDSQTQIIFTNQDQYIYGNFDEKMLRHIFINLLSNAIKYSPSGSVVDFIVSSENGEVIFQIQDRGIGIPKEEQKNLFEPFHRSRNVGKIPGTGLGLSIVKKSVDLHGGKITVDSEAGIGTTFTVTLPLINKI